MKKAVLSVLASLAVVALLPACCCDKKKATSAKKVPARKTKSVSMKKRNVQPVMLEEEFVEVETNKF